MLSRFFILSKFMSLKELFYLKFNDVLNLIGKGKQIRNAQSLRGLSFYLNDLDEIESTKGEIRISKKLNGQKCEFWLRRYSSDIRVFIQVILKEEYSVLLPFLSKLKGTLKVIDAGANIGLTSIYLAKYLNDSQVVALEPNDSSFKQIMRNFEINSINNVNLLPKGIHSKSTTLAPNHNFRDGESWSFSLTEMSEGKSGGVEVITLNDIIKEQNWENIDLLKLDIEGGEASLLRDINFNMVLKDKVKIIALEIHPEVISQQEGYEVLKKCGFFSFPSGDLTIGINPKFLQLD